MDTTPPVAQPPHNLVEAAAREIPPIFADHRPLPNGRVEIIGSTLLKLLQDRDHTLAAGHWAIHEAVQNGRLEASRFEVEPPTFGRSVGGTMRHLGGPDDRRVELTPAKRAGSKPSADMPVPFDRFKVTPTELLGEWWHSWEGVEPAPDLKAAKEPEPTAESPLPVLAKPKKAGRKRADYETIQREATIAAEWERAKQQKVYKPDFAQSIGMTGDKLDKLLERVAKRKPKPYSE